MITKIDAKGLDCPLPVIKTKNALDEIESGIVQVTVDGDIPKTNILKFAKKSKFDAKVIKDEDGEKIIEIIKGGDFNSDNSPLVSVEKNNNGEVIVFMSDKMGSGNDELGNVLIKSFLFTLTETKPLPKAMLFLNGGVCLTTTNEATVEHIKSLKELGVEVYSCGTCLDYYGLKEELKVGEVTNMYTIVEFMKESSKVITIG